MIAELRPDRPDQFALRAEDRQEIQNQQFHRRAIGGYQRIFSKIARLKRTGARRGFRDYNVFWQRDVTHNITFAPPCCEQSILQLSE